jgi:hypothetical protein
MKKIKHISDLRLEKKRLAHDKAVLEHDIQKDWEGLHHAFEPAVFARGAFFSGITWIGRHLFPTRDRSHKTS